MSDNNLKTPGSTKKKNKKKDKEKTDLRSTQGADHLSSITEGSEVNEQDDKASEEDEGADERSQFEKRMEAYMRDNAMMTREYINRIERLEATHEQSQAQRKLKFHEKKKKKKTSVLDSMKKSMQKRNWQDLSEQEGGSSPDDSSSSSSSSSENSDSSSNSSTDTDSSTVVKAGSGSAKSRKGKDKGKQKIDSPPPRASLTGLFKDLDKSTAAASTQQVTITRVEKECNIRIKDFNLASMARAMKKIMEFQEKENTKVNMNKVLDYNVKQHLKILYNVQPSDLSSMPMSTVFGILARETKVHNKVSFYTELYNALSHIKLMEWNTVNTNNHQEFYFQQLELADTFMIMLKLMLKENVSFCPAVNDKPNGLIRLFADFHNRQYWKHMWSSMKQKYTRMDVFVLEYKNKALEQFKTSQIMQVIPYHDPSKGDAKKLAEKEKAYYDKKREISKGINRGSYSRNSLNHLSLDNDSDADSDDSEGSVWRSANPENGRGKASKIEDEEDSLSEEEEEEKSSDTQEEKDENMLDTFLAAFGEQKTVVKADKKDYPCLRKILSGKCDYEGCPYGHARNVLLKGAQEMKGKLDAYISSAGTQKL